MGDRAKIKVLLWAPYGAGTHFWGPGISAFRLYSSNISSDELVVDLLHSSAEQDSFPCVYSSQFYVKGLISKSYFTRLLYLLRSLVWILRNYRYYDVVHGLSSYYYTIIPLCLFNLLGVQTVIKITGSNTGNIGLSTPKARFLLAVKSYMLRRISAVICISDEIEKNLSDYNIPPKKIWRIPNGVDTDRFSPLDNKGSLRNDRASRNTFSLLYVGGLTRNKRVIELAEAVKQLIHKGYAISLTIVGPDRSGGHIEDELREIICGIKEIKRIAHTRNPELYYRQADAFVLVSKKEGLSNSLLEAMSSGLAVICTNVSGSSDLIKHYSNGFLVSSGSINDITDAILKLYDNPEMRQRIGGKARETILNRYSNRQILKSHLDLFSHLVKQKSGQ